MHGRAAGLWVWLVNRLGSELRQRRKATLEAPRPSARTGPPPEKTRILGSDGPVSAVRAWAGPGSGGGRGAGPEDGGVHEKDAARRREERAG